MSALVQAARRQALAARRHALACALTTLWAGRHATWLGLGTLVLPAAAQPAPNAAVQRARARLDAVTSLNDATRTALRNTERLANQLDQLATDWPASNAASAPAQAALQRLQAQALPALQAAQQAWADAATLADGAVLAHLAAVAATGAAAGDKLAAAMALADTRAAERRQAVARHQQAGAALVEALRTATDTAQSAIGALDTLHSRIGQVDRQLADTAADWAALHSSWQALQAPANAAVKAGWLTAAALAGTGLQPARAAWAPPAGAQAAPPALANAIAPLRSWATARADTEQARRAIWLRQDAEAFVRRMLQADGDCANGAVTATSTSTSTSPSTPTSIPTSTPAGASTGIACTDWRAEQQALTAELATQHTLLGAAQARRLAAQAGTEALPAQLQAHWQALQAWRADQAVPVAAATGPGATTVHASVAAGNAALQRLDTATEQARQRWLAAWQAQYTSVGTSSLGVVQRLQRLLSALTGLPSADDMPVAQRATANTFVVPAPQPTAQRPRLDYTLRLGQALMSHVPPGLLLPGAARRALTSGNGPFLITLPGRLAEARTDWPVLFADLSQVPEAVVVDVVRSYMGDLLNDFSVTRTAWQPPAVQQVALVLVRLVQGTGDLVQAVFPAAVAAPR